MRRYMIPYIPLATFFSRFRGKVEIYLAVLSSKPKSSLLIFRFSMIASTTKSEFSTAFVLSHQYSLTRIIKEEGLFTHASVVVSIFCITAFVKPSISSGCFFFAILAKDLEMILRPFLHLSRCHSLSLFPSDQDIL